MVETEREYFKRLYNEQGVKFKHYTYKNDAVIDHVYNECPICGKIHELEKRRRTVVCEYNIGTIKYEEEYYHCSQAKTDKCNFQNGMQLDNAAKNRREKLFIIMRPTTNR